MSLREKIQERIDELRAMKGMALFDSKIDELEWVLLELEKEEKNLCKCGHFHPNGRDGNPIELCPDPRPCNCVDYEPVSSAPKETAARSVLVDIPKTKSMHFEHGEDGIKEVSREEKPKAPMGRLERVVGIITFDLKSKKEIQFNWNDYPKDAYVYISCEPVFSLEEIAMLMEKVAGSKDYLRWLEKLGFTRTNDVFRIGGFIRERPDLVLKIWNEGRLK